MAFCRRKEREARTVKNCCLRAAVAIELLMRKKTAARISAAAEGKMRARKGCKRGWGGRGREKRKKVCVLAA